MESLEGGLFSSAPFKKWAEGRALFCHITSKVEGEKYPNLLCQKGGSGWPYICVMDSDGAVLAKVRERSIKGLDTAFAEARKARAELAALRTRIRRGDTAASGQLFGKLLAIGRYRTAAEARRALQLLPADQRKRLAPSVVDLEITEVLDTLKGKRDRLRLGGVLAGMQKRGVRPIAKVSRTFGRYWALILEHAAAKKDAALYEKGLAALLKVYDEQRYVCFFTKARETLASLKKKR